MARTRSAVHSGFLSSWTANGLHERVLQRIRTVLEEGQCDPQHVKVKQCGACQKRHKSTLRREA